MKKKIVRNVGKELANFSVVVIANKMGLRLICIVADCQAKNWKKQHKRMWYSQTNFNKANKSDDR